MFKLSHGLSKVWLEIFEFFQANKIRMSFPISRFFQMQFLLYPSFSTLKKQLHFIKEINLEFPAEGNRVFLLTTKLLPVQCYG